MAICLQVILDAGWTLSAANFDHFLEISGVLAVCELYWQFINDANDRHVLAQPRENVTELNKQIFKKGHQPTDEELQRLQRALKAPSRLSD